MSVPPPPDPAPAADSFQAALALFQAGDLNRAKDLCQAMLARQPGEDRAIFLIGLVAHRQGDHPTSLEWMRRAAALKPQVAGYHANLAAVLNALGRNDDAIAAANEALRLQPNYLDAQVNLANALLDKGSIVEAIAIYRRVVGGMPPTWALAPLARNNLARALHINGQLDEAIALLEQCVSERPGVAEFRVNLANALKDQGRIEEAIEHYRAATAAAPDNAAIGSALLYALWFDPRPSEEMVVEEHRTWSRRFADSLRDPRPHQNDRSSSANRTERAGLRDRRLRVGYISPDFRQHASGYLVEPVLSHHDHKQFEIFCYNTARSSDDFTQRLKPHADTWRDVFSLSDEALAEQIRRDQIDILVDVTSHMAGNRLFVFARKPAPVQVTWLAYPATSGLAAMDYRITCELLEPDDGNDAARSAGERLMRVPHTFWCYGPSSSAPDVNDLPALGGGKPFTFGSLNAYVKVNAEVVALWSDVLRAVPNSRLLVLIAGGAEGNRSAAARFAQHGIAADRMDFVAYRPRDAYLALFHQIDLALDPFPYNGHTTGLDALWMGVPFVTLAGNTGISRGGACLLENVELAELIARDRDRYVELCIEIAKDLPRLREWRSSLRGRMSRSPLMDAGSFTRNLEEAYRRMWIDGPRSL